MSGEEEGGGGGGGRNRQTKTERQTDRQTVTDRQTGRQREPPRPIVCPLAAGEASSSLCGTVSI